MQKHNIILAIDPGTVIMGYAVLSISNDKKDVLAMNVLKFSAKKDAYARLQIIHHTVSALIQKYRPTTFAIEAPFFGKNVQSMLKLGRAQGVAIAAAMQLQLAVTEYSPKKVKQAITGNGNASKEQVWKMLQHILQIEEQPMYFDATDALAVALCHYYQTSSLVAQHTGKSFKSWTDFAEKNKERITKNK